MLTFSGKHTSISMNFKNLKKNNVQLNNPVQNKATRTISKVRINQNDDDDGGDNDDEDEDTESGEDTNGGCDDCNSDDDLEAEDYVEYDQGQPLSNPSTAKDRHANRDRKKSSNDKRKNTKSFNVPPVNMLRGGERYYANRALDKRWKFINNNNRFKGGYPESQSRRLRLYGGRSNTENGKRRIKQFASSAGKIYLNLDIVLI